MDAIANIMNLFIFVFCILVVNIDKTVVCTSVKSIKSLSLSLYNSNLSLEQSNMTALASSNGLMGYTKNNIFKLQFILSDNF